MGACHEDLGSSIVPVLMRKTSRKVVVVFTSVPSRPEAVKIGKTLVRKKLVACATTLTHVQSFYQWEGRMVRGRETLIMLKTTSQRYPALEKALKAMHPYEIPEIIAIPVRSGYPPYLGWVLGEVGD